ncbi:L-arabinose transport system substrate-binding protein [Sporomusaceae bacterium BoRhaA]|uniref:arabinose ABC transporter substrate-binding protein n=1 Tax=Pelorhabdus rhamnosifermentans TaxID=2772457 RepID=UPI001C060B24|nr:arabinose ABC transporter substrate-binding protein [Pelorhabdus rhamnosifermentans]MBU2701906.1 L-arabinose transport system substrate-binding protein [Pelorhabdus rhamnosifermentans]
MKLKKIFTVVLGILFVSLSLLGCGSGESDQGKSAASSGQKKLVIAGIYKAGDQVWFIDEGKAAEKMAKDMGAAKFLFVDAKMNPDTYMQAVENVIAQKVDGVVTCIPDQKLSKITVEKFKQAGIPVIAVDDALQDESNNKLVPWVGINAYKIGQVNGEWMANYAKQNNLDQDAETGLLVLTMDTVSSCVPRTQGEQEKFKEILPSFAENRVFKADYTGETDKGFNAASAIFTAHPEIKKWMVMSANEEGAVGAVRALEQAGLDKSSCVIGLGGYLAKDEYKKPYSAMKAATYFSSDDVGGISVKLLINNILQKTEIPMETAVDAKIVTPDNYKEVMGSHAN